ncbi:hypothetical protein EGW08_001231 [Elysia chlorotica]|uniref:Uncharacterized protein n=1 Tax=Elysia chlorotica TaxID=188477 RepID=A0A433UB22_ELYCH|nr:hypothetical protein EGW08_001231 [Elysia chlorotica]
MPKPVRAHAPILIHVVAGLVFVLLAFPYVKGYPQPCRFPRQYEGFRFQSSYTAVADDYVAVDCDRRIMYTRSTKDKDIQRFVIVDLTTNVMHIFNQERQCVKTVARAFEAIDYCEISRGATFTGEITLEGNKRLGWVATNDKKYEQTSVVTRMSKTEAGTSSGGCLPFIFRVRSDRHILMANTFYDVKPGISDPHAQKHLGDYTSKCFLYVQ